MGNKRAASLTKAEATLETIKGAFRGAYCGPTGVKMFNSNISNFHEDLIILITELVKRGVCFTVEPIDGHTIVKSYVYVSQMMDGDTIAHPFSFPPLSEVKQHISFIQADDACDDAIMYEWIVSGQEWPAEEKSPAY